LLFLYFIKEILLKNIKQKSATEKVVRKLLGLQATTLPLKKSTTEKSRPHDEDANINQKGIDY